MSDSLTLPGGADRLTLLGYGGAMGGGKTRAIAELAIDAALAFPGNNVLVARHHLSDLSSTTMKEFFAQVCPTGLIIKRRQQAPLPARPAQTAHLARGSDLDRQLPPPLRLAGASARSSTARS